MSGPTFVATFADGEITRMTTHCPNGLNLGRGVRLARSAYRSRMRREPPAMSEAHFETPATGNGGEAKVLKTYFPDELAAVEDRP
jgi:hypothetical protein